MSRLAIILAVLSAVALPGGLFPGGVLRGQTSASRPASPAASSATETYVREQLALARQNRDGRVPQIEAEIRSVTDTLTSVERSLGDRITADLLSRREELERRRAVLRAELKELQDIVTTWQGAADALAETQRLRRDLESLRADLEQRKARFKTGDALILQAQLQQVRSVIRTHAENEAAYRRDLADIEAKLQESKVDRRAVLEAQRRTLRAQLETLPLRRASAEARRELLEARLAAAREAQERGETAAATQPATQSAPSSAVAAREAQNKEKLAQALESEARSQLENARQQITQLLQEREEAQRNGTSTEQIENNLQYWRETENYERSRVRQASLKKREAEQKQQILDLEQKLQTLRTQLGRLQSERVRLSQEERQLLAEEMRSDARIARDDAKDLEEQATSALSWMSATQEALLTVDATEAAIQQRLQEAVAFSDYERLSNHLRRMRRVFEAERQQVDQMVTSQLVGHYQLLRQAQLKRQLADAYLGMADVLVPPVPSFWVRHKHIFRALGIFAAMVAAGYAIKVIVWLTEHVAAGVRAAVPSYNFSVKRVSTLASFAGSISRLFIWIFGLITILYEFGIDPATSSGAIGLVGLIMAGMFQQIVVDFIKGLDIVAGRHYNVGDFVELDGKFGHVIDFSVKYTRIRTLSGQEMNIPNSRCIPSRRFPEGYVDNYVDIVLKSGADVNEAKAAIQPICLYLNRRLEPLKERPQFVDRFRAVGGRAILRYRVRVLPGCDWVIKDYFIPSVRSALQARGIEMEGEPSFFFINRIDTFRKLFSRQLREQEILQEAAELEAPTVNRPPAASESEAAGAADKPPVPAETPGTSDKRAVPADAGASGHRDPSDGRDAPAERPVLAGKARGRQFNPSDAKD